MTKALARTSEADRLRAEIAANRAPVTRWIAEPVRVRAIAYAKRRRARGESIAEIAEALGVAHPTVHAWFRDSVGSPEFHAVTIVESSAPSAASAVVVTPRGLRIEGLDLDAVCQLIERIG